MLLWFYELESVKLKPLRTNKQRVNISQQSVKLPKTTGRKLPDPLSSLPLSGRLWRSAVRHQPRWVGLPGWRGELGRRLRSQEQTRRLHPDHQVPQLDQGEERSVAGQSLCMFMTGGERGLFSFAVLYFVVYNLNEQ